MPDEVVILTDGPITDGSDRSPRARVACESCGDWLCQVHGGHIGDCDCWPCEDCGDLWPADDLVATVCPECRGG